MSQPQQPPNQYGFAPQSQQGFGQQSGQTPYGQQAPNQPQPSPPPQAPAQGQPPYAQPGYGQPQQAPPQQAQPQYGQPQRAQPQQAAPQYGQQQAQPQYTQSTFAQPQQAQSQPAQPQYGQPQYGQSQQTPPPYGPRPTAPAPATKRPKPLTYALVALIVLVLIGMGALIGLGFSSRDTVYSPDGTVPMPPRWANNGYEPPEIETDPDAIPDPTSQQQAIEWTTENPIYDQEFAHPLKCELADLNLRSASDDELEEQLNAMVACLMGGWDQPLKAIDVTMPRPGLTVYDRTGIQTPCGWKDQANAFWCSGNQQLYYASHLTERHLELLDMRFGPELIMAHEFAHYIQGRVGIAGGSYAQREGISEDEALLLNRRHEAQADCFAGLFLHAITDYVKIDQADLDNFDLLMTQLGGNSPGTTHPYGPSRIHWLSVGLNTFDIGECNTYTADRDTVI